MKQKFIGRQALDFEGQNGQRVKGTNIFTAFPDENVQGFRTERFFIRENVEIPENIEINDDIELFFDHKGRVERIELA